MAVGMSNDTETPATVEPRQNGHAEPSERRSPSEPAKGQSISDQQSPAPQTGPHIHTGAVSGKGQNGNSTGDASTNVAASDSCKNSVTPLVPPIVTDMPSPPVAPPESAAAAGGGSDTTEPPDAKRLRTDSTAGSLSVSSSPAAGQQSSGPPALDTAGQRTLELIESSLLKLKREVKALDLLTRQKEREWDGLLKLRKAKEETFQRLRRKRQVLLIQHNEPVTAPAAPLPRVSQATAAVGSGMGPQGPTVSVRQLIESHRAASQPLPAPSYAESLLRRQQQQQPQMPPAADPHYREMLAQIAKLNKQAAAAAAAAVTGCSTPEVSIQQVPMPNSSSSSSAAAAGQSSHHSSLAKLLMESKRKQGDAVLSEMLKPHMSVSAAVAAIPRAPIISPMVQPRPSAPVPPPPAPVEDVPLCQGCRSRQAQFVCAGCGNQWYCSRECQVDSWDSHADECTG